MGPLLRWSIPFIVLWTVAAAGCQATSGKTPAQSISDASITAAVQSKLTGDRASNFTRVDVDTERGVVSQSGVVPTAEQRRRAEALVRQVEGVVRVSNNLQVQHQPVKTGKLHD